MRCMNCKFATWPKRTPTGRVMRHMAGKCGWTKDVRVASSCLSGRDSGGTVLQLKGGNIWPDDKPDCPVGIPLARNKTA